MKKKITLLTITLAFFGLSNANAQYTKLLDFTGSAGNANGSYPYGALMQASDGMLYGMTQNGGASTNCSGGCGVIFQYNPVTSTYTDKLDFAGVTNGSRPKGSLMQASDGMLYGMTYQGGANDMGVIFQYNPATNTYTNKYDFANDANGNIPRGSLMQASDGMLYGMTNAGGANTSGVIFQYNPSTSTYTKKFDFAGAANGSAPDGSLMQASDGMLYGMTSGGGASANCPGGCGVLFQYNPVTNTLIDKFDFAGATNGSSPVGDLMQASDGMLYGMTQSGGANSFGVLFQYNPATSTYTNKLDFAGTTNGKTPDGSLMQASDGMLYGMTYTGGANSWGVLFQYNPATNVYADKLDFAFGTNGRSPYGSLMQASDGMLYGMTANGGANNYGVLFKYGIATGISEIMSDELQMTISPNPTCGKFNLIINNPQGIMNSEVVIYNALGEKVYSNSKFNKQASNQIDLSNSPKGVYFVKINDGTNNYTKKIIIE